MDYSSIKVAVEDGVGVITLADPATLNAATGPMMAELSDALAVLPQTEGVRALLLTGEGRGFCSGASLTASRAAENLDVDGRIDFGRMLDTVYNPLIRRMRDLPIPLVTAVNGAAAGIGASFALLGDLVLAAEGAYFLQAFRRIGLVPDGGATWLLPRLVGKARAMELALLGEKLSAAKALEWGLINRVLPDAELMPAATALARELASGPRALGLIRQAMWDGMLNGFDSQIDRERDVQRQAGYTADAAEGIAAFVQKRPAVFTGR